MSHPVCTHEVICGAAAFPLPQLRDTALFLDVDGTLLEIASRPDAVVVEPELIELLRRLSLRNEGAVALVSGRSICDLDQLFGELRLPVAGLHGFERRDAQGVFRRGRLPAPCILARVRRLMIQVAGTYPGALIEDKSHALALHYRQVPEHEDRILGDVQAIARLAADDLELQRGRMVIELRPRGASKAAAVLQFMLEAPFQGRFPVCFGDDLTDESAFVAVNAMGGVSIAVNVELKSAALIRLGSVAETRAWLHHLLLH